VSGITRPAPAEDVYATTERRRAARALLMHPLLTADGPHAEEFLLVRRHREELTRLFADALGYRLEVLPRVARLYKAGLGRDPSRPLRRGRDKDKLFTPRGYALLGLTIAALTRVKDQLLVDELVAAVRSAAADAGLTVDLDGIADRRALHAALMALVESGVLRERDQDGGGLARWVEDSRARSLLDVVRDRLRLLLAVPLTTVTSPDELLDVAALPSAAGGARVAVRRKLVESPVMSVRDLTDDQVEWWQRNRNRERERLAEFFGLDIELRAEGALAVDPDDELSDVAFPGIGSTKQVSLLLLERLARWCAGHGASAAPVADRTWWPVPPPVVTEMLQDLVASYRSAVKKERRNDIPGLKAEVLSLLRDIGLVRIADNANWLVHAAAARYAPQPVLAGVGVGLEE
jgi:uncharacterized protein (TIGR02678 family)